MKTTSWETRGLAGPGTVEGPAGLGGPGAEIIFWAAKCFGRWENVGAPGPWDRPVPSGPTGFHMMCFPVAILAQAQLEPLFC